MPVRYIVLAAVLAAVPVNCAELRTLQGETISGDIVSITPREVVMLRAGMRVTTPVAQVLQIDCNTAAKPPTVPYVDVELTDGSLLHCEKYTIKDKEITLKLLAGPEVKIALSAVGNLLTEAQVEKDRKEWNDRLVDRKIKKKRRDVLAVRKEGFLNALEGTLGDGDAAAESIEFTTVSGKTRAVAQSSVAGLIFERGVDANAAPVVCKITDTLGDVFQASAVATSSGGLIVTTPSTASFELTFALVVRLDYSGGKLTWLSDLEPTQVIESFVDDNPFHYKRDHNLEDGPIRLDGATYSRGLALHSTTELEYDLKGDYREFKAVAGIDDLIGGLPGPTILRVEGDGKLLKELTFDRRDKVRQQEIVLNIKDVQKLRLRVAPGGEGFKLDLGLHLDIANAKVSK
jgi:hypothetical protein